MGQIVRLRGIFRPIVCPWGISNVFGVHWDLMGAYLEVMGMYWEFIGAYWSIG